MPPAAEQPTMRDIAAKAGVSASTVSKCLSGKRDVSVGTREKVAAICREMNYRPNPLVSALMRVRRRRGNEKPSGLVLAFVSAFPTADGWRKHDSPVFRQMFEGARTRALERSYRLEHFWLHQGGMRAERFEQMLRARGIRGVLAAPTPDARAEPAPRWADFSVVALGLATSGNAFHRVTTDYYQGMSLALEHIARCGYRRPGFAVRRQTNERMEYRWEAAYRLVSARLFGAQERALPAPIVADEWTSPRVLKWLRAERPDCVIGPVLGKLEQIIRASPYTVPEKIGMAGLLVPRFGDALSGIVQNGELIGSVAVDQLIAQIERNETGAPALPIAHTIPGTWNPGSTLRQRRQMTFTR